jgi:hypothetical protein
MYRWLTAGLLTALVVLGTATDSRADDTYRLNIVSGGNANTIPSGSSLPDDDADTLDVYLRYGGYGGYGGYRGYGYGGYRGYGYGGYGGSRNYGYGGYGGSRNYGYGGYGGYRNYYGGYGGYRNYYGGYGGYGGYRNSYGGYRGYYGGYGGNGRYWGISDNGGDDNRDYCLVLPAEKAPPSAIQSYPYELPGLPEQPKTFRYDGGPANPVPMPGETQQPKAQPAPVDGKLVSQPGKLIYPAYGEAPRATTPVRDVLTGVKK